MTRSSILTLLASISFLLTAAQNNETYSPEQCEYWLFTARASDLDSSGGLSRDEYYTFLTSIDDPPYVNKYFAQYGDFANLPWEFKVVHRTMACNCMRMGQTSGCCIGNDVEVMFRPNKNTGDIVPVQQISAGEYNELLCNQIGFLVSSVDTPPTMQPATSSPAVTVVGSPSPTSQQTIDKSATGAVEEGAHEQEAPASTSLRAAAIVGILFAILIPLCGGCFIFARQRKMEEEKRLREFAGEAAKEDHLASFDKMNEMGEVLPDKQEIEDLKLGDEKEIEVIPSIVKKTRGEFMEATDAKDNCDSEDDGSVWSDRDDEKNGKEIVVETDQDIPQSLVGSALAALGVASTVATSIISPTNKKSCQKKDTTKVDDLV